MRVSYQTATIPASNTTSGAISTGIISEDGTQLHGLEFPPVMTNVFMTFTGSRSISGTYVPLRNVGGAETYSVTVTPGTFVPLEPKVFATFPFIKLVGNINEAAERSIVVHSRPVN